MSSLPAPGSGRSGWAVIEELRRLRREERAADDAEEESTAAELRDALSSRKARQPRELDTPTG